MARSTSYTDEDPAQLTVRLLGQYAQAEGMAEDIAFRYLQDVPYEVVGPLLARTPFPTDALGRMLKAVMLRENPVIPDSSRWCPTSSAPATDLTKEWQWASDVRTDLAHSNGDWLIYPHRDGLGLTPEEDQEQFPDLWKLTPRSVRRPLKVLTSPFDVETLFQHLIRVGALCNVLMNVQAHLGMISFNGYSGPGPRPVVKPHPSTMLRNL